MDYLYLVLQNESLFEKVHFQHLEELGEMLKKHVKDKVSPEEWKKVEHIFDKVIESWKEELRKFRTLVNAEYSRAQGGHGMANIVFDHLHIDALKRLQEKKSLKAALREDKGLTHRIIDAIKHDKIKSAEDLEKLLRSSEKAEEEGAKYYEKLERLEFSTWDAFNHSLSVFYKLLRDAVATHELPGSDEEVVRYFDEKVTKLQEHALHSLRIIDNQLTSELSKSEAEL